MESIPFLLPNSGVHPLSPPKQTYTYNEFKHIITHGVHPFSPPKQSYIYNVFTTWSYSMITNHELVLISLILMQFLQQSKISSTDSPNRLFLNRYTISRHIIYLKFPKMRRIIYSIPPYISILVQLYVYNTNFIYSYKINIIIVLRQTPSLPKS